MSEKRAVKQQSVRELIDKEIAEGRSMDNIVERFKNCVLTRALEMTAGNKCDAAKLLKCHRNSIQNWIDEFGLHENYKNGDYPEPC